MFFIEQKGVKVQDIIHCSDQFCSLIGLDAPHYITLCKRNTNTVNFSIICIYIFFFKLKLMYMYI